ncbi:RWD domain-containing protein 2A-like [Amphiura filiformis]|uniref:RWD domain-containing protein 2A-like n=1 Tax=Amphiura filiformis TaxID=82378 RepID=UPI003B219FD5
MTDLDVTECLQLQLSEVEMLQSMFPSENEFCVDDPSVISDAQSYTDGDTTELPHQISFTLKIHVDDPKCDVEILCQFPLHYPSELPELFARSDILSRQPQKQLNDDLLEHVTSLERGEICIGEAIQWIQDNIAKYVTYSPDAGASSDAFGRTNSKKSKSEENTFSRLWIHSHHIYSKFKRKDILDLGNDSGSLTGFCLPGKPGIICVEGPKDETEDLWARIRRWNWKKISCKHREDIPLKDGDEERTFDELRKFEGFEEKEFDVRGGPGREYHMDLGLFYKFLEQKQCGFVFKLLLGVEGKFASDP